ncbi:MAG TPA: FadR/GntR family transcriptional regulator [Blastocatellia bacterium]|jgi:GntR family transcriptional repressor for pyruvate dehydrogenase complex|nr:FadR/GntR family transcriptional regulator [Blastocatellia bacterium]
MANRNLNHSITAMEPIDRAGITELVVQRIKELLGRGELKAGSRLPPERELADMLHISRPSLRTALKALSVMGVIHAKPGAGTYIAKSLPEVFTEPMHFMTLIHNTSVEELFEARLIIEAGLAELAAERASESDIAALIEEVEEMKAKTADPEEFLKHDVRFHQAMARAANNKLMGGVMDTVAQLLFHIRRQTIARANDLEDAIEWHEKIVTAMQKHDPKRAKDTISGHLRAAQSAWAHEYRPENNGKVEEGDKAGKKKARGR